MVKAEAERYDLGKQKSIAKIRLAETKEIPLCEAKIYVNRKQEEKGKIRIKPHSLF